MYILYAGDKIRSVRTSQKVSSSNLAQGHVGKHESTPSLGSIYPNYKENPLVSLKLGWQSLCRAVHG